MATLSERPPLPTIEPVVNYDEPPVKPPPITLAGPLAWMRKNLFATPFDAVLTVITGAFLAAAALGLLTWAVGEANWLVITRNLRLFMLGVFPVDSVWRVNLAVLIVMLAIGFTLRAFGRITRPALIAVIAVCALLLIAPPVIMALTGPASAFLAVGDREVESGTVTERPIEALGFIARAGETITVTLAQYRTQGDNALAGTAGFLDRAAQGLFNAAANRLADLDERAALEDRLASDLLTERQRAEVTEELADLAIPDPVYQTYALNTATVSVQILDGGSPDRTVLAEGDLVPLDLTASYEDVPPLPSLSFTLPADGWYVLRTISADDEVIGLIEVTGIYPLLERDLGGGNITYSRAIDDFETAAVRPTFDGRDVSAMFLNDNQYQGTRPLADYLRLMVAPLFDLLARGVIPMAIAGALGYLGAVGVIRAAGRGRPRARTGEAIARWLITPLWAVGLIALFLLPYGVANLTPLEVGILLARFAWVGLMFFAGAALTQPWGRPLLALAVVIGLAQGVIGERLFDAFSVGGLIGIAVWLLIGIWAARQGAARTGLTPRMIGLGAVGSLAIWAALLIVPVLVLGSAGTDLLPVIDTRRWGGLLLTMMLTIVAILASFPLGVLLALGRRSDLPAVKWGCTIYIELVRGVPLITVLFMAQLLVPLVNAGLADVDNVIRAMVGITLFSGAYLAENVRGGLQSIPPGQEEAAKALGLAGWQVTLLITLPQALRAVIPALVGQSIALFKDTSLVALVGLTDLTGIARGVIAQTEFVGLQTEVYVFISVIYFIFSYVMAYVSRRIEASGSGAARRI